MKLFPVPQLFQKCHLSVLWNRSITPDAPIPKGHCFVINYGIIEITQLLLIRSLHNSIITRIKLFDTVDLLLLCKCIISKIDIIGNMFLFNQQIRMRTQFCKSQKS